MFKVDGGWIGCLANLASSSRHSPGPPGFLNSIAPDRPGAMALSADDLRLLDALGQGGDSRATEVQGSADLQPIGQGGDSRATEVQIAFDWTVDYESCFEFISHDFFPSSLSGIPWPRVSNPQQGGGHGNSKSPVCFPNGLPDFLYFITPKGGPVRDSNLNSFQRSQ